MSDNQPGTNIFPIVTLDDPRIAPYRNLKDRELARQGGLFIAEGAHLVRRLLESNYKTESVFLSERRIAEMAQAVPDDVPIFVAHDDLMRKIIGFKFHSGVIACGRTHAGPDLEEICSPVGRKLLLVICPELANAENMGAMIRISAAFGAEAMILGERCCDPFWRQSVRVSMGTIFRLPLVRSRNLMRDLSRLRNEWDVELAATVPDQSAEPLATAQRTSRMALLFGNEAQGLDPEYVSICDRRITIPMHLGTDSLNVSVAAAVFLYHFTK